MSGKRTVTSAPALKSALLAQATVHAATGTVYVSGNVGVEPETMKLVDGGVTEQTKQAIRLMAAVLEEAGSGLDKILKCTLFLANIHDYAAVNKVWMEMIPDPKPARTAVAVAALPLGAVFEIECVAHL